MLKKSGLFVVIVILVSFESFAQQRKYVNEFLNIGVGARGLGMAGAQVATVNDVMSPFSNPAGLSLVRTDFQLGYMHSEYFSGIAKYDYIGAAFPLKLKKGIVGFSLIRYAIDDIPYTLNLIQSDGSIDYSKIKAISAQDYAGLITYAKQVHIKKLDHLENFRMSAGGNFKIIHRNIGSLANAWGAGLDFGAQAQLNNWRFGASFKDITTTYTLWSFSFTDAEKQVLVQNGNEVVSRNTEMNTPRIVLGTARKFPIAFSDTSRSAYVLAEVNTDISTDGKRYGNLINLKPFSIDPKLGLEFGYNNLIFVRAGIGNFQRVLNDADTTNKSKRTMFQPSVGAGVKIKNIKIDYSFSSLNIQNNPLYSHFISFRFNINKRGSEFYGIDADAEEPIEKRVKKKTK
jgi:hypothetical protein